MGANNINTGLNQMTQIIELKEKMIWMKTAVYVIVQNRVLKEV